MTLQMRNSISGSTNPEDDYIISPIKKSDGKFYCSKDYKGINAPLPTDADANGAYNIARKALWTINKIKEQDVTKKTPIITNADWLEYTQP